MKRTPGRPPLDTSGTPPASVHLKLRAADYDRLDRLARQQRISVQEIIRKELRHMLTDQRSGTP